MLRLAPLFGVLVSLIWILACAALNDLGNAGDGGAVGITLSLLVFFTENRNPSKNLEIMERIVRLVESNSDLIGTNPNVNRDVLREALKCDINDTKTARKQQDRNLALSSIISTIAWGFGDNAASFLRLIFF